jgi:hypothetical protein
MPVAAVLLLTYPVAEVVVLQLLVAAAHQKVRRAKLPISLPAMVPTD